MEIILGRQFDSRLVALLSTPHFNWRGGAVEGEPPDPTLAPWERYDFRKPFADREAAGETLNCLEAEHASLFRQQEALTQQAASDFEQIARAAFLAFDLEFHSQCVKIIRALRKFDDTQAAAVEAYKVLRAYFAARRLVNGETVGHTTDPSLLGMPPGGPPLPTHPNSQEIEAMLALPKCPTIPDVCECLQRPDVVGQADAEAFTKRAKDKLDSLQTWVRTKCRELHFQWADKT